MNSLEIFQLYQQIITVECVKQMQQQSGGKVRRGIYCTRVVVWMMMLQRLYGATLAAAVQMLIEGAAQPLLEDPLVKGESVVGLEELGIVEDVAEDPRVPIESKNRSPRRSWDADPSSVAKIVSLLFARPAGGFEVDVVVPGRGVGMGSEGGHYRLQISDCKLQIDRRI